MSEELENKPKTRKNSEPKAQEVEQADFVNNLTDEQKKAVAQALPNRIVPGFFLIRRTNKNSKQISYIQLKKEGREMPMPENEKNGTFYFELAHQNIEQEKQNLARMIFAGVATV